MLKVLRVLKVLRNTVGLGPFFQATIVGKNRRRVSKLLPEWLLPNYLLLDVRYIISAAAVHIFCSRTRGKNIQLQGWIK